LKLLLFFTLKDFLYFKISFSFFISFHLHLNDSIEQPFGTLLVSGCARLICEKLKIQRVVLAQWLSLSRNFDSSAGLAGRGCCQVEESSFAFVERI
jgi:hypothetical protein